MIAISKIAYYTGALFGALYEPLPGTWYDDVIMDIAAAGFVFDAMRYSIDAYNIWIPFLSLDTGMASPVICAGLHGILSFYSSFYSCHQPRGIDACNLLRQNMERLLQ
jgi:hypothetical protein